MGIRKEDKPIILSVKEAADLIGVNVHTMYDMANSGRVPFDRVGVKGGQLRTTLDAMQEKFPTLLKKRKDQS